MRTAAEIVDALARELLGDGDSIGLDEIERRRFAFERVALRAARHTPQRDIAEACSAHLGRLGRLVRIGQFRS